MQSNEKAFRIGSTLIPYIYKLLIRCPKSINFGVCAFRQIRVVAILIASSKYILKLFVGKFNSTIVIPLTFNSRWVYIYSAHGPVHKHITPYICGRMHLNWVFRLSSRALGWILIVMRFGLNWKNRYTPLRSSLGIHICAVQSWHIQTPTTTQTYTTH